MKSLLTTLILTLSACVFSQNKDVPVQINLKDSTSINAKHFGQLKCGNQSSLAENYILIRGKFMGSVTEIKTYDDIEKIVFEGYEAVPETSVGNEKGTLVIVKKNGVTVTLEEAEVTMSCYGSDDKYNEIVVQISNPLTGKATESRIETRNIKSVIFR